MPSVTELRVLDTRQAQDDYYQQQAATFGLHFFSKTGGEYHVTEVTECNYPDGLFLSYTDSKLVVTKGLRLKNKVSKKKWLIKAGTELPAGVRLVPTGSTYQIELPGGRKIKTIGKPTFSGGQLVCDGRVILTAPSIDMRGQVCIDTYTISAKEASDYYHKIGDNRLAVNVNVQTPREMVPLDPEHPIVLVAYDGTRMTHDGPAWMVRIPANLVPAMPEGGYYICAEKDLMRIFDGLNDPAKKAKEKWLEASAQAKRAAGTKEAKTVRYEMVGAEVETPSVRYVAVMPRKREELTSPLVWVNVYGARDGNFSADIQLPGDSKIFELPPKETEWYCNDKEWFDATYVEGPDGQVYKTAAILAQELDSDGVAVWRYSGNQGDFLVTPLNQQGVPKKEGRYIIERREFLTLYLDEATAKEDIAAGRALTPLAARGAS